VFSGCSDDCSFASVADLGFFAHEKDGERGFSVYAGGGLGSNPRTGIKIEDFVKGDEIFKVAEAVKKLFDAYGDRSNKHRARLRYVLDRKGEAEFVKLYEKYKSDVELNGLEGDVPEIRELDFSPTEQKGNNKDIENIYGDFIEDEKYPGYYTVEIRLRQGDISAEDMVKIAEAAENFGQGIVRTSQYQNMLITSVPQNRLQGAIDFLENSGIELPKNKRPEIISCTGAATCKLGICLSRGLADAITEELKAADIDSSNLRDVIRISGCPNSCANHHIANLGFQGRAKRINGRLVPFYDVLFGAKLSEGDTKLAKRIGSLPAKRVPQLVGEYFSGKQKKQRLDSLVTGFAELPEDIPEDFYYDYGSDQPFSLAGRGAGECGAGVLDVIRLDIHQSKDSLKAAKKQESEKEKIKSAYQALLAAGRSLLIVYGLEPKKDRKVFAAFRKHLVEPGWVKPQTGQLIDDALDWRMGDSDTFSEKISGIEELVSRVEQLYQSLDSKLEFQVEPYTGKDTGRQDLSKNSVDLRGVGCPLNFVKAKLELEKLQPGDILEVLLDKGEPSENTPASLAEQGQEILDVKDSGDYCCVRVKRKK
jgi:sulfite reductase (ferredoxin)